MSSSFSNPGYISEENESINLKRCMQPYIHSIIYNIQVMETTQMPIYWWMDKGDMVYIHMHNGILVIKKEWNIVMGSNGDGIEDIMLSEINETERKKYCMISLYVEYKKHQINKNNRSRFVDTENKHVAARGEMVGEGKKTNEGGGLRSINFHLRNKWVTGIKSTLWGIGSLTM